MSWYFDAARHVIDPRIPCHAPTHKPTLAFLTATVTKLAAVNNTSNKISMPFVVRQTQTGCRTIRNFLRLRYDLTVDLTRFTAHIPQVPNLTCTATVHILKSLGIRI